MQNNEIKTGYLEGVKAIRRKLQQNPKGPQEKPEALKRADIATVPSVFQHRSGNLASEAHVDELAKSLLRKGPAGANLGKVTVFWIGDRWACLDGHHRLEAYEKAKYQDSIPVSVFSGTLNEAIAAAVRYNSKDKLPMRTQEKANAAWRLTLLGEGLSKAQVALSANVSERLVGYMRKTLKTLRDNPELLKGEALGDLTWQKARTLAEGGALEVNDDYIEKEAQELAGRLAKNFGKVHRRNPEIWARAIALYAGDLPKQLVRYWRDEDEDWMDEEPEAEEMDF